MKTTFFAIFDPTWTHLLASKGPNKEFLRQYFSQERQKLYYYHFCAFKTKVKFLKIISFLPFLTQIGQICSPKLPSNVAFVAIFALYKFPLRCMYTTTTFCFKRYSPFKIWKKPVDNNCFFTFFHNTGPNLAQILPQDHIHFDFFSGFWWNMLGNAININNFNWNPVVLKNNC